MLPRQGPLPGFTGLAGPAGSHSAGELLPAAMASGSCCMNFQAQKKMECVPLRLASFLSKNPLVSLVMGPSHELTLCGTLCSLLEEGSLPKPRSAGIPMCSKESKSGAW